MYVSSLSSWRMSVAWAADVCHISWAANGNHTKDHTCMELNITFSLMRSRWISEMWYSVHTEDLGHIVWDTKARDFLILSSGSNRKPQLLSSCTCYKPEITTNNSKLDLPYTTFDKEQKSTESKIALGSSHIGNCFCWWRFTSSAWLIFLSSH